MPKKGEFRDLTGQRIGKWTVVSRNGEYEKFYNGRLVIIPRYICRCDCGNEKTIRADVLKQGRGRGCRICAKPKIPYAKKHGDTNSKLYLRYRALKDFWSKKKQTPLCDEWAGDYLSFKSWAVSLGYVEGDRIIVNYKRKEIGPSSCAIIKNIYDPDFHPPKGLSKQTIYSRIYLLNWSVAKALSVPPMKRAKK